MAKQERVEVQCAGCGEWMPDDDYHILYCDRCQVDMLDHSDTQYDEQGWDSDD